MASSSAGESTQDVQDKTHSNQSGRAVRTRFAPSPTGFIHLGNIRSALYPWAFARSRGGAFILRVEDTDVERSSQEAVQVILDSMEWLGLGYDDGPIYQMQRMGRYQEVLEQLRSAGLIYPCYMSLSELDALREGQLARKEKPRYDGTWRPEPGKTLPAIPAGVQPVWRFKSPQTGVVAWDDQVKGRVEVSNTELDDLVVARSDGTPTYNFCVVVDDMDMGITHVIRGDDHVNNTPRQINIFQALDYPPPVFAHLPTVLNAAGEKMSKRNGAKAVTEYRTEGYLPEALVNYLARLGWSHGDDEVFSRAQFLQWFDLEHLGKSAAQFDEAKLRWINAQHMKSSSAADLAKQLQPLLHSDAAGLDLVAVCALFQDRCETLVQIADWVQRLLGRAEPNAAEQSQYLTQAIRPALDDLYAQLQTCDWTREGIAAALKTTLKNAGLKMPQLAMPVRVALLGQAQSPSLDAVISLISREEILSRLRKVVYF